MTEFDFSLITQGGPMIIVLGVMAVVGMVLFLERTLYLHRGHIRSTPFVDGIKNILEKRRVMEALTVCEETPGPVAAVVKAALLHVNEDAVKMRFAVQEAGIVEIPALEGTVLGMATTFHAFMSGGAEYATARALADGMWQALLVTIGSLTIAIPAYLGHHFLRGRVRSIVRDVEWAGNEIMRFLQIDYRRVESGTVGADLKGVAGGAGKPGTPEGKAR
jgi:biopolymer transport protein ExbB